MYVQLSALCTVGHWQNKPYPYPPYQDRTLGDGILMSLDMHTDYWWCWLGLGVNLAYIFLFFALNVLFLAILPPYGENAMVAKTAEELADRQVALYGDYNNADDIMVQMHVPDSQQDPQDQIKSEVSVF